MQRIVYHIGDSVAVFVVKREIHRITCDLFKGITPRLRTAPENMLQCRTIAVLGFAAGFAYTFHHMLLD